MTLARMYIKKLFKIIGAGLILSVLVFGSCASGAASGNGEIITRSAGTVLGTVSATAAVSENRTNGTISGDTGKYGFIDNMPQSRIIGQKNNSRELQNRLSGLSEASDKAIANAVYEIIQQVKAKGGNAVNNVATDLKRNYDPETKIETVTVSIAADAVRR